jgi:hypothetical protein
MPKIDLSTKEKICLAGYAVLGKEFLADAFDMSHNVKTKNQESLAVMRSKWIHKPQAKDFILNIRKQYTDNLLENIGEDTELSEKQLIAIIQRGIVSEKDPKRQSDMSLKLMQWRKDAKAEQQEEERRKYVLSFRSVCRVCPLMATYRVVCEDPTLQGKEYADRTAKEPARMIEESRKAQEAARKRIISGQKESGDDKCAEALGWMFSELGITDTDCYDILDFLKRQKEGKNDSPAHWMR